MLGKFKQSMSERFGSARRTDYHEEFVRMQQEIDMKKDAVRCFHPPVIVMIIPGITGVCFRCVLY